MSGAVEGVALLPCPNPWCKSGVPPMPFTKRNSSVAVICGCDFHGPAMASRDEAITAWNTRTTPPARSYADAIANFRPQMDDCENALRPGLTWLEGWYDVEGFVAAIRLLSQGGKA